MTIKLRCPKKVTVLIYCLTSPIMVFVEEFVLAGQAYTIVSKTLEVTDKYKNLNLNWKEKIIAFGKGIYEKLRHPKTIFKKKPTQNKCILIN